MGPPTDRKEPKADPKISHSGPARRPPNAGARGVVRAPLRGAMRPEPARAFPCPPAARWVHLGPLGTAPPRAGPERAVSAPAGARVHHAAEGRAHDPTSARVWRAGPLCEILGSAPGSLRSVGGPIGPLGCQRAPAGSPANARKPPRQRPKTRREFWHVHCNGFQKRDCILAYVTIMPLYQLS